MAHKLAYGAKAHIDLRDIYRWISDQADPGTALGYVARVQEACSKLCDFPEWGTPRDDLAPGLRTVVFERRVLIAYFVGPRTVRIIRVLPQGRDLGRAFHQS